MKHVQTRFFWVQEVLASRKFSLAALIALLQAGLTEGATTIDDNNHTENSTCSPSPWLLFLLLVGGVHIAWVWLPVLRVAARRLPWLSSRNTVPTRTYTPSPTAVSGASGSSSEGHGYTTTRHDFGEAYDEFEADSVDEDWDDPNEVVCFTSRFETQFHSRLSCLKLAHGVGIRRWTRCDRCGSELRPFESWERGIRPRGRAKNAPAP
jgi:hypothetical protein